MSKIPDIPTVKQTPGKEEGPAIAGAFLFHTKYKPDSQEQCNKEEAIAQWTGQTDLPPPTVQDQDFLLMEKKNDRGLTVPIKTTTF